MSSNRLKDIKDLVLCLNLNDKKNNYSLVIDYNFQNKLKIMYPVFSLYGWNKKKYFDDDCGKYKYGFTRKVFFEKLNQLNCIIELSRMVEELNG